MKTVYILFAVVIISCFGCSGIKPTNATKVVPEEKVPLPTPIEKAREPNRPASLPEPPLPPTVELPVQPHVKKEVRPLDYCQKGTSLLFIMSPPYGEGIPGSSGKVTYCLESSGAFQANVTLNGLKESHPYALSLNGKVGSPGNDCLPEKYNNEGFINRMIQTDKDGSYKEEISIRLKPCEYIVKFLVKDVLNDYKVVLYNDDLSFTITK